MLQLPGALVGGDDLMAALLLQVGDVHEPVAGHDEFQVVAAASVLDAASGGPHPDRGHRTPEST